MKETFIIFEAKVSFSGRHVMVTGVTEKLEVIEAFAWKNVPFITVRFLVNPKMAEPVDVLRGMAFAVTEVMTKVFLMSEEDMTELVTAVELVVPPQRCRKEIQVDNAAEHRVKLLVADPYSWENSLEWSKSEKGEFPRVILSK